MILFFLGFLIGIILTSIVVNEEPFVFGIQDEDGFRAGARIGTYYGFLFGLVSVIFLLILIRSFIL